MRALNRRVEIPRERLRALRRGIEQEELPVVLVRRGPRGHRYAGGPEGGGARLEQDRSPVRGVRDAVEPASLPEELGASALEIDDVDLRRAVRAFGEILVAPRDEGALAVRVHILDGGAVRPRGEAARMASRHRREVEKRAVASRVPAILDAREVLHAALVRLSFLARRVEQKRAVGGPPVSLEILRAIDRARYLPRGEIDDADRAERSLAAHEVREPVAGRSPLNIRDALEIGHRADERPVLRPADLDPALRRFAPRLARAHRESREGAVRGERDVRDRRDVEDVAEREGARRREGDGRPRIAPFRRGDARVDAPVARCVGGHADRLDDEKVRAALELRLRRFRGGGRARFAFQNLGAVDREPERARAARAHLHLHPAGNLEVRGEIGDGRRAAGVARGGAVRVGRRGAPDGGPSEEKRVRPSRDGLERRGRDILGGEKGRRVEPLPLVRPEDRRGGGDRSENEPAVDADRRRIGGVRRPFLRARRGRRRGNRDRGEEHRNEERHGDAFHANPLLRGA